jgi:hypothetical protein
MNDDDFGELANAREADDIGDVEAARRNAIKILSLARGTPGDIAWAWVTLLDVEAGNGITPGEARYRKILFAQEEIDKLGLLKTDEAGFPVRKYKGVPVSGTDDRGAGMGMVAVSSVREAMILAGAKWPNVPGPSQAHPTNESVAVNSRLNKRYSIDYVIEMAIKNAGTAEHAPVWDELCRLAIANVGIFHQGKSHEHQPRWKDENGDMVDYSREALRGKLRRWRGKGKIA